MDKFSRCYFYDGRQVKSLTDGKIRKLWVGEWEESENTKQAFWLSNTSDIPGISYDPKSKKLMCVKTLTDGGSDKDDILMYSFKTQCWTMMNEALTTNTRKRFAIYRNELVFDNQTRIQVWNDTPITSGYTDARNILKIKTKDFDFGAPGVRKKVYKVYISYRVGDFYSAGTPPRIYATYGVNGDKNPSAFKFKDGLNFTDDEFGTAPPDKWTIAELKPDDPSEANNIYSFRLSLSNALGNVYTGFEIGDITIIYRLKHIK